MITDIVADLRAIAQECTRLERDCSDDVLSRALQELGVNLTAMASDLERKFDR